MCVCVCVCVCVCLCFLTPSFIHPHQETICVYVHRHCLSSASFCGVQWSFLLSECCSRSIDYFPLFMPSTRSLKVVKIASLKVPNQNIVAYQWSQIVKYCKISLNIRFRTIRKRKRKVFGITLFEFEHILCIFILSCTNSILFLQST